MRFRSFNLTLVMLVVFVFNAYALDITFGDSSKFWPGWGGGYCTWDTTITDNSRDTIGTPDLTGGAVTINGSELDAVTIKYNNTAYYGAVTPGDLFIDTGSDGDWDYVVDTSTKNIYSFADGAFKLNSTTGYVLSGDCDYNASSGPNYVGTWIAPYPAYWDIRDDHPVLYSGNLNSTLLGQATITPATFVSTAGTNLTYTYTNLNLNLTSNNFIIGWTIDCANDVLYQKVTIPPVPEPGTLFLLGAGLIGLAGLRRMKG